MRQKSASDVSDCQCDTKYNHVACKYMTAEYAGKIHNQCEQNDCRNNGDKTESKNLFVIDAKSDETGNVRNIKCRNCANHIAYKNVKVIDFMRLKNFGYTGIMSLYKRH